MRPNKNHNFKLTVLAVSIATGLTACGGGGTSGALIVPAPATPTAYSNPDRVTWTTNNLGVAAGDVKVAVVDSGFKTNHFEIADAVVATRDQVATGTMLDGTNTHGTYVAEVIAGKKVGFSGNVDLMLAKAADGTGTVFASNTGLAGQWAIDNGARVVNLSLTNVLRVDVPELDAMYNKAATNNAIIVAAAGNSSANLSTSLTPVADVFDPGFASYRAQTLVVGALSGNSLAAYSNFAGETVNVQNRFLVTDGTVKVQDFNATSPQSTDDINTVQGTSFAAPKVAAAAATVMSYWPHMTGDAVASLLLSTADRNFTNLYSQNNCGSGGTTNCGLYYFGQGKLNLAGAMSPVGLPVIPISYSLSGPSVQVAASSLSLPGAFGDAGINAQLSAAMFDDYGRDFRFNAFNLVGNARPASFASKMMGQINERVTTTEQGRAFSSTSFAPNGAIRGDLGFGAVSPAFGLG